MFKCRKYKRQKCKKAAIDKVYRSVPYSVYFFSSNLDHVIHNNANLDDYLKDEKATEFAKKYKNNPQAFISFFQNNDFALMDEYNLTWEFIKIGIHSLQRYTNFGLLFSSKAKNDIVFTKD